MTQLLPIEMAPKPEMPSTGGNLQGPSVEDTSLRQDDDVPVGKSFSEALEQAKLSGQSDEADNVPPQSDTVETDTKLQPEKMSRRAISQSRPLNSRKCRGYSESHGPRRTGKRQAATACPQCDSLRCNQDAAAARV